MQISKTSFVKFGAPLLLALAPVAFADSVSYTGTLTSSTDIFETTFTLASSAAITLQTWGFGGGVNAGGGTILPGGTDPFVAIFSGTGPDATILTDASSNPFGTAIDLGNYASFEGCPPAGAPSIGGSAQCGDITMTVPALAAGTYTVVLSDGEYIADAVFDNGMLGEGFTDFTGGNFCNIEINGVSCPNTSGAYALDIDGLPASGVPEPADVAVVVSGLLLLAARFGRRCSLQGGSR
jgi:hypothetical protein